jgi:ribosomal protein L15
MTLRHKKSKTSRGRGTRTHCHGNTKNRRGRGSRMGNPHIKSKGGGQRNRMHLLKYMPEKVNKKGFKSIYKKEKSVNISELGKLSSEPEIDVTKFGYQKILGRGELDSKIKKVKAKKFSEKALDKIKKAGATAETIG